MTVITVEDFQALSTLPKGTTFLDAEGVVGVVTGTLDELTSIQWVSEVVHGKLEQIISQYEEDADPFEDDDTSIVYPAIILNPVILGNFYNSHTFAEVLAGLDAQVPANGPVEFSKGDRVQINLGEANGAQTRANYEFWDWDGATAEVVSVHQDWMVLAPLSQRPDGFGFDTFHWNTSEVFPAPYPVPVPRPETIPETAMREALIVAILTEIDNTLTTAGDMLDNYDSLSA